MNSAFRSDLRRAAVILSALGALAIAGPLALCACTSEQLYSMGQGWQRQECMKMIDSEERSRCIAATNRSYDSFKRDADAVRAPP
jgi:hypothetical protein